MEVIRYFIWYIIWKEKKTLANLVQIGIILLIFNFPKGNKSTTCSLQFAITGMSWHLKSLATPRVIKVMWPNISRKHHNPQGFFPLNFRDHTWSLCLRHPGGWSNIKMSSYQYRKFHCGDKTILRLSYLLNVISYTGKMTSLYWIRALDAKPSAGMVYTTCCLVAL